MGATNSTTYYNLSQFVGTDKPAWLQDYNGDMGKIDAGIHEAKAAADAAQGDATQALTDSGSNTTAIGNLQTDVGLLQTATGNNAGAINSINSLIGNGTPTTTDQTIIGAINELNKRIILTSINIPSTAGDSAVSSNFPEDMTLDNTFILNAGYNDGNYGYDKASLSSNEVSIVVERGSGTRVRLRLTTTASTPATLLNKTVLVAVATTAI